MLYPKLKKKLKAIHALPVTDHYMRLHRAISWMKMAEEEERSDLRFLGWWIAFNACYASEPSGETGMIERDRFQDFLEKLVSHDDERRISNMLWNTYTGPVRILIENKFVFKAFWDNQRGQPVHWQKLHEQSIQKAHHALSKGDVLAVLAIVLDRLYTLRNQLFHGGATFNSKVNRSQVKDGCSILAQLVPVIIDVMIEHPDTDWGKVNYPVID